MTATLLRPGVLEGRAVAADGAIATACAAAGPTIVGPRDGKIVLLAPRPEAGEHAGAAGAALENLARTPAVERARFGIRTTVVAPGRRTADDDVGAPVAFLASAGGDYLSGCRFALR